MREHREFLTAVVVDRDGFHLDVATARSEFYRAPAALPEVATSAIRQDLYRRDFTINTLAIRLGPDRRPALIDHFGGREDLDAGVLRVLHSMSFIDDPTRVLRAVRLEHRLGFRMSPETLRLVEVALAEGVFRQLSGSRLREELKLLLDDPAVALPGLERLGELGLLAELHPDLGPDLEAAPALGAGERRRLWAAVGAWDWFRLQGLEEPPVELWRLLLAALAAGLDEAGRERFAGRLQLAGADRRALVGGPERRAEIRRLLAARPAAHAVVDALDPLPGEDLLLLLAEGDPAERRWIRRYLRELRRFEIGVRGGELVAAGVAPGPAIGEALRLTREARLDGAIGAADERRYALDRARELAGAALRVLSLVAVALAVAAGAAGAVQVERTRPEAEAPPISDRSLVLARLDCRSTLQRRELTLFANGTLRLRAGEPGREGMSLAELGPDELEEALARLGEVDLDETDASSTGPEGDWVDRCTLELALPDRATETREFKRFDSISLALARALDILEGLAAGVEEPRAPAAGGGPPRLPVDYRPEVGDLLRHADGTLYRVIAFTADGEGVELQGVEQPLTLYVPAGRLAEEMVALVGRRKPR